MPRSKQPSLLEQPISDMRFTKPASAELVYGPGMAWRGPQVAAERCLPCRFDATVPRGLIFVLDRTPRAPRAPIMMPPKSKPPTTTPKEQR
jgi:hypothetical protein